MNLSKCTFYTDFPKSGINFLDIFPLFSDSESISEIKAFFKTRSLDANIAAPESRGFLLAPFCMSSSISNGQALIPFRKEGKLPFIANDNIKACFSKEYGSECLISRKSDIKRALAFTTEVVIVDDVLATGGTAKAIARTLIDNGMTVRAFLFLAEVSDCNGREILEKIAPVESIIKV